jgi:hypothetical protein
MVNRGGDVGGRCSTGHEPAETGASFYEVENGEITSPMQLSPTAAAAEGVSPADASWSAVCSNVTMFQAAGEEWWDWRRCCHRTPCSTVTALPPMQALPPPPPRPRLHSEEQETRSHCVYTPKSKKHGATASTIRRARNTEPLRRRPIQAGVAPMLNGTPTCWIRFLFPSYGHFSGLGMVGDKRHGGGWIPLRHGGGSLLSPLLQCSTSCSTSLCRFAYSLQHCTVSSSATASHEGFCIIMSHPIGD